MREVAQYSSSRVSFKWRPKGIANEATQQRPSESLDHIHGEERTIVELEDDRIDWCVE